MPLNRPNLDAESHRDQHEQLLSRPASTPVIDNPYCGVAIVGRDGLIHMANTEAARTLGLSTEQLCLAAFRAATRPGEIRETDLVMPDGQIATIEVRVAETEWEGEQALLVSLQDVTEHKRTETSLREGETRFRTILESAAIGISVNTFEGRPILSNPALQEMLGYSNDELQSMDYTQFTHPDDCHQEAHLMQELITGQIDSYQVEKRYVHKDGRIIWGRLTASLLRHPCQEPEHFVAMVEDITKRKRAESESQQRAAELEVIAQLSLVLRQADAYPEVIECVVEQAAAAVAASACALLLLEDSRLNLVASRGLSDTIGRLGLPEDGGHLWQVIRSGQPVYLPAETRDQMLVAPGAGSSWGPEARLAALIPLRSSDVTIGILYFAFERSDTLLPSGRRLLEPIADIASNAIQRAKVLRTLEQQVSDRTRRLRVLYEVSAATSEASDLRSILASALETLTAALPESSGCVSLLDDGMGCPPPLIHSRLPDSVIAEISHGFVADAPWERVLRDGLSFRLSKGIPDRRMPESLQSVGLQTYLGVPIRANSASVGVLSLFWPSEPRLTIEDLELISAVAGQFGRSIERSELRRQADHAIVAEERQRFARDLHDSITQLLCGQALLAEASRSFVQAGDIAKAVDHLDQLVEIALQSLKEMRLMIYDLRPSVLNTEGLVGAISRRLQTVEQRAGMDTRLCGEITTRLSRQQEESLYRVTQELLNNVLKHAGATAVTVTLSETPDSVAVEVVDNGKGFNPDDANMGIGLASVRERIECLGGTLTILSTPEQGSRITARLRSHAEVR